MICFEIAYLIDWFSAATNSGSVSNNCVASTLVASINGASSRVATRKLGNPLCAVPYKSPGPRSSKSACANEKPSVVSSRIYKRCFASLEGSSESK